jgi:hypothetical protein
MRLDRRQVALGEALNERGLGTILFDLVEATDDAETESDLEILTERLIGATEWSLGQWGVDRLPLGYVGSGLGSAASLVASVALGPTICAIASHGGRPDLAADGLGRVRAPTLFPDNGRRRRRSPGRSSGSASTTRSTSDPLREQPSARDRSLGGCSPDL